MSISITIHNLDDSAASWIHNEAEQQGVEAETIVLSLIYKAIRQKTKMAELPVYHDSDHSARTWGKEGIERFLQSTADESNWLKRGTQQPFKSFKACQLQGEGPTASEMVIQDRI